MLCDSHTIKSTKDQDQKRNYEMKTLHRGMKTLCLLFFKVFHHQQDR